MRFRATFSDRGIRILERAFLPTLEKCGKSCQVLLGPEDVHFIQTPLNTDGMQAAARFQVDVLFDPSSYRLNSKHFNLVSFKLDDVALLLRVLRGAGANAAETLEVRLATRKVSAPGSAPGTAAEETQPVLTFTCKGAGMTLVQELPISQPYPAPEIDRLVQANESTVLCPFYVDLQPCVPVLQGVVERMKSLGDTLMFATCKNGDVHLAVSATNVLLGTQVPQLGVFPQNVVPTRNTDRSLPAEQQLQAAVEAGDAAHVYVQLKHLSRVLNVSSLSTPAQLLCGIGEGNTHVHVMYVYRDPERDAAFDESISFTFKLPVKDEH